MSVLNIRLPITIAVVLLAVLLGGWLAVTLGGESSPVQLPWFGLPVQRESGQEEVTAPEGGYLVKEYEGKVAVFVGEEETPGMVLDLYVQYLPPYDQQQLKQGVPVDDYPALVRLLEDYAS